MTTSPESLLQTLLDREAIREAMYSYCRGIDRCDETALRSAYWPDATDRHGAYSGSANGFIAYAVKARTNGPRMVHHVSNISILLKENKAAVESYFQAFQCDLDSQGKPRETFLCGRYIDRFEKRGSEWRIAERTVVYDWMKDAPGPDGGEEERFGLRTPLGKMKPDDAWYALIGRAPFST